MESAAQNLAAVLVTAALGTSQPSSAAAAPPAVVDEKTSWHGFDRYDFLFQFGGPSQVETFDPKMGAPDGIRRVVGEIATARTGVTFGSSFPHSRNAPTSTHHRE
jgi:hypothetical protein